MPYYPQNNHNRVGNIKKKFENLSDCEGSPPKSEKSCTLPGQQRLLQELTQNGFVSKGNAFASGDGKAVIKRSPAFRCDRIVCGKNVTNLVAKQDGNEISKVILRKTQTTNTESQPKKLFRRSNTDINLVLLNKKAPENVVKTTLISKESNLLASKSEKNKVNDKIIAQYAVVNKTPTKGDSAHAERSTNSNSIRLALQSPLPEGPPPKKPPRTFLHTPNHPNSTKTESPYKSDSKQIDPRLKLEKIQNFMKSQEHSGHIIVPRQNFKIDLEKRLKDFAEEHEWRGAGNTVGAEGTCFGNLNCAKDCSPLGEKSAEKESGRNRLRSKVLKDDSAANQRGRHEECSTNVKRTSLRERDGQGVVPVKSSPEPIYDMPFTGLRGVGLHMFETFGKAPTRPSNLHYMCTELVNPRHKENDLPATKTFPPSPNRTRDLSRQDVRDIVGRVFNADCSPSDGSVSDSESPASTPEDCRSLNQEASVSTEDPGPPKDHLHRTQVVAMRKVYVKRVSSKLLPHSPYLVRQPERHNLLSLHLFESCLLVGLTLSDEGTKAKKPYIKSVYPPHVVPPPNIEVLCFPDASDWPPPSDLQSPEEQCYSLVITDESGARKFGYCRRVLPEGGHFCLPLAYCIISPFRANGFYHKVLEQLESRHGSPGLDGFIQELYDARFPGPGKSLKLNKILEMVTSQLALDPTPSTLVRRPCDVRLEDRDLTHLLQFLDIPVFLKVFSSLLLERKVLLVSHSLRKLSSCTEALQSVLFPFSWQHTLIPVLPAFQMEMCEAPTPYVIGLLKPKNWGRPSFSLNLEEGMMVDLDERHVVTCCGDEATILPTRFTKALKRALTLATTATPACDGDGNRNVLISEAFVRFFVEVCGHYSTHIHTGTDGVRTFDREGFIEDVKSSSTQSFLEWFTETAMFHTFIHDRLQCDEEDLFRRRSMEHSSEMEKNTALLLKNYKAMNKKVKSLGTRFKDLSLF